MDSDSWMVDGWEKSGEEVAPQSVMVTRDRENLLEFHRINKQGVQSDSEDFVFQRKDRFTYHYSCGDHLMIIVVEDTVHYEEIYLNDVKNWEAPHNSEQITEVEMTKIRNRIIHALEFMNSRFKIL